MLGHLVAHQGQGGQMPAVGHQDVRILTDQVHIAGSDIQGSRQIVKRLAIASPLDEDVGIGQLVVHVRGVQADNFPEGFLARRQITVLQRLGIGILQYFQMVTIDGQVVGIDLRKAFQKDIGFLKVALFLIQVDFSEPQPLPIGVDLQ